MKIVLIILSISFFGGIPATTVAEDLHKMLKVYEVHVVIETRDPSHNQKISRASASGAGTGVAQGKCYITTIANIFPRDHATRKLSIVLVDRNQRVYQGGLAAIDFATGIALVTFSGCQGRSPVFRIIRDRDAVDPVMLAYNGPKDRIEVTHVDFLGRIPGQPQFVMHDPSFVLGKAGGPVYDGAGNMLGVVLGRIIVARTVSHDRGISTMMRETQNISVYDSSFVAEYFIATINRLKER